MRLGESSRGDRGRGLGKSLDRSIIGRSLDFEDESRRPLLSWKVPMATGGVDFRSSVAEWDVGVGGEKVTAYIRVRFVCGHRFLRRCRG